MTDPDREPAGDYGYDEAHGDMARRRTGSPAPDPQRERTPAVGAGGASDGGTDYGYDEAHGF